MIQFKRKTWGTISAALLATLTVFYHQACTQPKFSPTQSATPSLALNGNGDSYSGKLALFSSVDTGSSVCQKISKQGRPFPKRQIFFANGSFSLVRDNCQDITPIRLDPKSIVVDSQGENLIYQGESFAVQTNFAEFDQVPVVCPSGVSASAGNLYTSPLDLSSAAWRVHPEIRAQLDSSLEALPKYRIEVTDPTRLESWRRVSQNPNLLPSTQYVTTFLLQAGSVEFASITYNELPAGQFVVVVDLIKAEAFVEYQTGAANPIITSVQRYGNGVAVSVAFTSSSSMNGPGGDLGVAPYRMNNNNFYAVGDSVYATAAHLNICR